MSFSNRQFAFPVKISDNVRKISDGMDRDEGRELVSDNTMPPKNRRIEKRFLEADRVQ